MQEQLCETRLPQMSGHTCYHLIFKADVKHIIFLCCEGEFPSRGLLFVIKNMTLGICYLKNEEMK